MGGNLDEKLIPEGLRDVYRKVRDSVDYIDNEPVKVALYALLRAVETDTESIKRDKQARSKVIPFNRPTMNDESANPAINR